MDLADMFSAVPSLPAGVSIYPPAGTDPKSSYSNTTDNVTMSLIFLLSGSAPAYYEDLPHG